LICIKSAIGAACFLSMVCGADKRSDHSRQSGVDGKPCVGGVMVWTKLFGGRSFLAAAVAISALLPPMAGAEEALSPPAQRGLVFVRTHCAKCHAIDRASPSPLAAAPPCRKLHERYPVETLQESLAEGIVTGHPSMPEFQLDPGQVNDVITYLKSLEN
jgi:cytochrome c